MISLSESTGGEPALATFASNFFGKEGALSHLEHFEYRPQQQQMAVAAARALAESRPVLVEAGTGVGKSLAYMAPAVELALREHRKAIISTHTINLQEQLVKKDIPLLQKVLHKPFRTVLLKGRRNYLCPVRLEAALVGGGELFTPSEEEELQAIFKWAEITKDGTLAGLGFSPSPKVWGLVCSEPHVCTTKKCGPGGKCFYQEARKRVNSAHVVVVNHTLFFTLLGGLQEFEDAEDGFLFPNDFVIFDEAHTMEAVAARILGLSVSKSSLRFELNRLFNPKSKRGLFQAAGDMEGRQATMRLMEEMDSFFEKVAKNCKWGEYGREFRVRHPEFVEDTLGGGLIEVSRRAREVADLANDSLKAEFQDLARRLGEARAALATFLDQSDEESVYWVEKDDRESITLNAVPIDVSPTLRSIFFTSGRPGVFTSATLGVGDRNMNYFRSRVGAENAEGVQIGSPFDYRKQMSIYLVKTMPSPGDKNYESSLIKWIEHFTLQSKGRAFVLFTSYKLLQKVAGEMEKFFEKQGWDLLVQGQGFSRNVLIDKFKKQESSVLFGTDSFWTGVDVPGSALSNVIITRLPFAVPDHPLTQSRIERIEERGGNAFMEFSVPEAILKLRQGVGRLIRHEEDRGMVVLLDNRILTKRYGKTFLNALPNAPVEIVE
ncbi:MAG: helicase C-terminal domain-containing protein [Verrucomicrobiales bacterium]|nr:helicase C-terminal domain-containing protein [Verrucomicrobiales bacterium]